MEIASRRRGPAFSIPWQPSLLIPLRDRQSLALQVRHKLRFIAWCPTVRAVIPPRAYQPSTQQELFQIVCQKRFDTLYRVGPCLRI
jgi:hypothetical protein